MRCMPCAGCQKLASQAPSAQTAESCEASSQQAHISCEGRAMAMTDSAAMPPSCMCHSAGKQHRLLINWA